jgi:hypothetical protein
VEVSPLAALMRREIFTEDHDLSRDQVRGFAEREIEEVPRVRAHGLAASVHSDICLPYIVSYGSEEQKRKYVPHIMKVIIARRLGLSWQALQPLPPCRDQRERANHLRRRLLSR